MKSLQSDKEGNAEKLNQLRQLHQSNRHQFYVMILNDFSEKVVSLELEAKKSLDDQYKEFYKQLVQKSPPKYYDDQLLSIPADSSDSQAEVAISLEENSPKMIELLKAQGAVKSVAEKNHQVNYGFFWIFKTTEGNVLTI